MKFLNDKNEYITWMIEEVFMTTRKELEEETSFLDWQEDVLPEIEKKLPGIFPLRGIFEISARKNAAAQ
jgi:hypothetical protein